MIFKVKTDKQTKVVFNFNFKNIGKIAKNYNKLVLIVDHNVYRHHTSVFAGLESVIVVEGGENTKTLEQSQLIINQLLAIGVDKNSLLIGVGGGVITDLVGFVASIYKRGIPFGFIPTTVLCAVDAAIGGKNGVNQGLIKNCIGTINQPDIILYDYLFFKSLPHVEFANGFAEIIKYGCICDVELFNYLDANNLLYFINSPIALQMLIQKCLLIKSAIIRKDPNDLALRKTLNFGHTIGHAIEKNLDLKHGFAVSIGMIYASQLSVSKRGFSKIDSNRIARLLEKYELPISAQIKSSSVLSLISNDKKKNGEEIDFILLKSLGESEIVKLSFDEIKQDLKKIFNESNSISVK